MTKVTAFDKDKTNKGDVQYGLVAGKLLSEIQFSLFLSVFVLSFSFYRLCFIQLNSLLRTLFLETNPGGIFAINETTGNITLVGSLDRKSQSIYALLVSVSLTNA